MSDIINQAYISYKQDGNIFKLVDTCVRLGLEKKNAEDQVVMKEKRKILIDKLVKSIQWNKEGPVNNLINAEYKKFFCDINSWQAFKLNKYEIDIGCIESTSDLWNNFCDGNDCFYKKHNYIPNFYHTYYKFVLDDIHFLCEDCIKNIDSAGVCASSELIEKVIRLSNKK